jgi:hypothetical protein
LVAVESAGGVEGGAGVFADLLLGAVLGGFLTDVLPPQAAKIKHTNNTK